MPGRSEQRSGVREEYSAPPASSGPVITSGSWDPVPLPSTGTITRNTGGCLGRWIKNGDVVSVWFQFQVTSVAGPTGTLRVTGLPAGQGLSIPLNGMEATICVMAQNMTAATAAGLQGRVLANEDPPVLRVYGFGAGNPILLAPFVKADTFMWGFAQWTVSP